MSKKQEIHALLKIQHKLVEAAKVSVLHLLWYFTKELVVFGLFNDQLPNKKEVKWLRPFSNNGSI